MATKIRSYTELCQIEEFSERYKYLRLHAPVGGETFGFDRYLNQRFYTSREWRDVRNEVITRDRGCDLGVKGYEIYDRIAIHHMNPMSVDEIVHGSDRIVDPEYLILVSLRTHNAIHFGDEKLLRAPLVVRRPGDTKLW
jgi:hypothetical protein